jgi:hypothetical protein
VLHEPVVLVDPNLGPRGVAAALDAAAEAVACDLVALVDVGGDVLGHGHEETLASPLCDAVLLAASAHMRTRTIGAIFGPGCDGELKPAEVLERVAEVARAGGLLGAWGLTPQAVDRLQAAVDVVPTEASAQALHCARGQYGPSAIRDGRRSVELSPVGAVTFFYDAAAAMASAARLATAIRDADSLDEAQGILERLGVRTELGWERDAAVNPPA